MHARGHQVETSETKRKGSAVIDRFGNKEYQFRLIPGVASSSNSVGPAIVMFRCERVGRAQGEEQGGGGACLILGLFFFSWRPRGLCASYAAQHRHKSTALRAFSNAEMLGSFGRTRMNEDGHRVLQGTAAVEFAASIVSAL